MNNPLLLSTPNHDDVSLSPAQRRHAARACFVGATIALGASLVALMPLWTSPIAGHLPILRVILFLLAICQTAGVCLAALLWRRSAAEISDHLTAVSASHRTLAPSNAVFGWSNAASASSLSASDLFVAAENASRNAAPATWWTDANLRQENRQMLGR